MEKAMNSIVEEVILSASASVLCVQCGVEELIMPMDDQPLDEAFLANYVCDECENRGHP